MKRAQLPAWNIRRRRFRWRSSSTIATFLLVSLASASSAFAATVPQALYWVSDGHGSLKGAVGRQALAGGPLEVLYTFPGDSLTVDPLDLEVDPVGMKMYWADSLIGIRRMSLSGGAPEDLITGISSPRGLALDLVGGKLYWAGAGGAFRSNLDGSGQEQISALANFSDIDVDQTNRMLYAVQSDAILRRPIASGSFTTLVSATLAGRAESLELDPVNDRMFWTTNSAYVQRSDLDGEGATYIMSSLPSGLGQITADSAAQQIYIANGSFNDIMVADYDGNNRSIFAAGVGNGMIDVRGIDIGPLPLPCAAANGDNLTLSDDTVLDTQAYEVCDTIDVGPNYQVMGPNGHLTLRAGAAVILNEGASVGIDGTLIVENGLGP